MGTPITLFDLNGEQRFTGTSVGGGGAPMSVIIYDTISAPQVVPHNALLAIAFDDPANPLEAIGSGYTLSPDMATITVTDEGVYVVGLEVWFDSAIAGQAGMLSALAAMQSPWGGFTTMVTPPAVAASAIIVSVTSNDYLPAGGAIQGYAGAPGAPGDCHIVYAGIAVTRVA